MKIWWAQRITKKRFLLRLLLLLLLTLHVYKVNVYKKTLISLQYKQDYPLTIITSYTYKIITCIHFPRIFQILYPFYISCPFPYLLLLPLSNCKSVSSLVNCCFLHSLSLSQLSITSHPASNLFSSSNMLYIYPYIKACHIIIPSGLMATQYPILLAGCDPIFWYIKTARVSGWELRIWQVLCKFPIQFQPNLRKINK